MNFSRNMLGIVALNLLFLVSVMGCGPSMKTIREDGERIFQDVHVPADAVILHQYQQDSVTTTVNGCKGIEMFYIYGINRPVGAVLNEYIEEQFANDWYVDSWDENSVDLTHFYKGAAILSVDFVTPIEVLVKFAPNLQTQGYVTIYSIDYFYAVHTSGDTDVDCDA